MTTERDIRNQIRYAEKQGLEQGIEQGKEQKALETARNLKALGVSIETIVQGTGLTEEQVRAL
jgi:predicted transposase/invertase (TIGR01784 family)